MPNPIELHLIFASIGGDETPWAIGAWDELSIEDNPRGYEAAIDEARKQHHSIAVLKTTIDLDVVTAAFNPALPEVESTPLQPVEAP